jgi:hypothetical protein
MHQLLASVSPDDLMILDEKIKRALEKVEEVADKA